MRVRLAGAMLCGACLLFAAATTFAQNPAVNASEADSAATQQKRQLTQPYNNQPVWSEVRSGIPQYTSIPGRETNVLIQPQGQTWRAARGPVMFWGGLLFAAAVLGLAVFYMFRGPIEDESRPGEPIIERFSPADRYAHWGLAITWVTLAVTGLVMSLGKSVLLPLIGYTLFSWLAILSKNLHNFIGPLLIVLTPILFVRFIRDNGVGLDDIRWFTHIRGFFSGHEYPSDRFNAGEKAQFWLVLVVATLIMIVSGLVLVFPNFEQTRSTMQVANLVHMITAYIAIALTLVHIYLGTIGMKSAYRAMRDGYVTATWAKHHHIRWYERVMSGKARQKVVEPGQVPADKDPARQVRTA